MGCFTVCNSIMPLFTAAATDQTMEVVEEMQLPAASHTTHPGLVLRVAMVKALSQSCRIDAFCVMCCDHLP